MRLSAQSFERATGYRVVDHQQLDGGAPTPNVLVEVPGSGRVELPIAQLEQLFQSYTRLRGEKPVGVHSSTAVGTSIARLRADLNVGPFDSSPFTVTNAEAKSAHETIMRLSPGELSQTLEQLDDKLLNRYFKHVAKAEPFSLSRPSILAELATKIALELNPQVGKTLVARLDDEGKRRLMEGVLQLPTGALVARMRAVLGEVGFVTLSRGGKNDSLVGGGLIAGKVWKENVTLEFKQRYDAALSGELSLPARAKETVFLAGPGLFGDQLPGYLEPNKRALREWGVPEQNIGGLAYNTADHPEKNADRIFDQIKALHDRGKRVVVFGHSKFGRDMLEAFRRHPELKQMVDGAIMMQPALSAPIASDLKRPEMKGVLDPVLRLVGGNRGAFEGLAERLEDLPPWPADVPTVVFASSTESPHALLRAGSHLYYQHFYNAAGDGAVAFQDQAAVDGAYAVTLPGLADHAQPGLTFRDLCEHFAAQIEAGQPDEVVRGMLDNLRAMVSKPALVDAIIKVWRLAHDAPKERERCVALLRETGPALDRVALAMNRNAGYPLVDNEAMTRALVTQLFDRLP